MQGLLEQHNERVVVGGPLAGKVFGELDAAQLKRAAKRYVTDPKLQKFAKAKIALQEIVSNNGHEASEPVPCAPVRLPLAIREQNETQGWKGKILAGCKDWINSWLDGKILWCCIFGLRFLCFCKPPLSTVLAKHTVRAVRMTMRKLIEFIVLIFEGVLDEIIYQLDHLVRSALPFETPIGEAATATVTVLSHCISALVGASMSLLTSYLHARRQQVA